MSVIYEVRSGEEMDISLDYSANRLFDEADEHWEMSCKYEDISAGYFYKAFFFGVLIFWVFNICLLYY